MEKEHSQHLVRMFNDYWMYYLTADMARKAELPKPYYTNIAEYKEFKHIE